MSEAVASYVSTGGIILADSHIRPADIKLAWYNNEAVANEADVLLVDDPNERELIEHILDDAVGTKRAVVVAFDPYQVENDIDDSCLSELKTRFEAKQYTLTKCYRQKENVGKASKRVIDVIAAATPYRNSSKIDVFQSDHANVKVLANDLSFPNPGGYEYTYESATIDDVRYEIQRIRKQKLWKHSHPVLVVGENSAKTAPSDWKALLGRIPFTEISIEESKYDQLFDIKGLEFQHVFLNITRSLFDRLEDGKFGGQGNRIYFAERLLRIPWTRAKDSMVTFVWDSSISSSRIVLL